MPWEPPADAGTPEKLSDWWLGTCRRYARHEGLFVSLGWGDRLNLLFAVAGVRAAFGPKLSARDAERVDLVEGFADGRVAGRRWSAAVRSAEDEARPAVHRAVLNLLLLKPEFAAGWLATQRRHREVFGRLLRAMVGPGMPWEDGWRTGTAVALAEGIYEDRAWDRLPILADALQDAGCADHRVIGYCRGDGPFARGCWLLDVVLAKR